MNLPNLPFYACPECGDLHVEQTAWIHMNNHIISSADPPLTDYWCPRCEENTRHVCCFDDPNGECDYCGDKWQMNVDNPHISEDYMGKLLCGCGGTRFTRVIREVREVIDEINQDGTVIANYGSDFLRFSGDTTYNCDKCGKPVTPIADPEDHHDHKSDNPKCMCNIMFGCTCGVFESEQKAKKSGRK